MKSMMENRGRWDAGFRSPLLRYMYVYVFVSHIVPLFISYVHITAAPYTCTQTDTHTHMELYVNMNMNMRI